MIVAGGVNVTAPPPSAIAVSPLDGTPAWVTRMRSPSGSESLSSTSNTSGALPATASTDVVERLRGPVGAGQRHDADEHLADGDLTAGVDERVREAVGAGERVARRVDDEAGLDAGHAAGRLGADVLDGDDVAVGVGVVGDDLDGDGHAAAGARQVGAGDRRPVDLVGRHDAHLEERAGLVAGVVDDRVAEREAGHDARVDADVGGLAVEPGRGLGAVERRDRDDLQRAALGVVVVGDDRARRPCRRRAPRRRRRGRRAAG